MDVVLRSPGTERSVRLSVTADGRWDLPASDSAADIGEGLWALPGLVDSHAHLAADELTLEPGEPASIMRRAYACLDNGTFLVVDKGWLDDSVVATLSSAPPAEVPDFEAAGRMIAVPDGYYPGFAVETGPAGLAEVVASAVGEGRGWVKVVGDWPRRGRGAQANFGLEELVVAVEVAHAGGARVAIHSMAPEVASMAVAAGVDSIEHGLFLTESDLRALGEQGGAWVPTVRRVEAIAATLGTESSGGRLMLEGLDNVASLLGSTPPGVAVLAGTDLATAPGDVGREVVGLIERGLSPERALAAATDAARAYLGRPGGFEAGMWADAVLYDADPLEKPAVLSAPTIVLHKGRRR